MFAQLHPFEFRAAFVSGLALFTLDMAFLRSRAKRVRLVGHVLDIVESGFVAAVQNVMEVMIVRVVTLPPFSSAFSAADMSDPQSP